MNAKSFRDKVIERVTRGPGDSSAQARQAAFANAGVAEPMRPLIDKVAKHAWKVTDEDVAAVRGAQTDDQVYEQVVAAALGQASRQLDAALAALAEAAE